MLSLSGCVRSYQPLTGLHDPVVVDPGARNFPELSLHVYRVPGKAPAGPGLGVVSAGGALFENQAPQSRPLSKTRLPVGLAGRVGSGDFAGRPGACA